MLPTPLVASSWKQVRMEARESADLRSSMPLASKSSRSTAAARRLENSKVNARNRSRIHSPVIVQER